MPEFAHDKKLIGELVKMKMVALFCFWWVLVEKKSIWKEGSDCPYRI